MNICIKGSPVNKRKVYKAQVLEENCMGKSFLLTLRKYRRNHKHWNSVLVISDHEEKKSVRSVSVKTCSCIVCTS